VPLWLSGECAPCQIEAYRSCWSWLGSKDMVDFKTVDNLCATNFPSNPFDFVWNFAYLPMADNQNKLIQEMKRISKNGVVYYNRLQKIALFMRQHMLNIVKKSCVDCTPWPYSLGFRQMRLHLENIKFDNVDSESPYVANIASSRFPLWIKLVYAWEKAPNFAFL
jgi:hypothetical protein